MRDASVVLLDFNLNSWGQWKKKKPVTLLNTCSYRLFKLQKFVFLGSLDLRSNENIVFRSLN